MKVIGLTGGIGSGKSTVLEFFKALRVVTYVADVEAKRLLNTNLELIKEITALFGEEAYKNQQLNRAYIASIVFKDKIKLEALNALVHPKVQEDFKRFLKNCKAEIVLYEAAILFESGSHKFCDYIITVIANFEDRIQRVSKRDGVSENEILDRIKNQTSDDFRIKNSHFVIKNGKLESTKKQVFTAYDLIVRLN